MSRVSQFLYTNGTDNTHPITPKVLGVVQNYSVSTDAANDAVLDNKTAPIDAKEIISYRTRKIAQVNNMLNIQNPSKVKGGIQYTVEVDNTLVTTDSTDPNFRIDEPIVATLSIRHPLSGNITSALVASVVTRLLSACYKSDGSWRWEDLMRSSERPIAD